MKSIALFVIACGMAITCRCADSMEKRWFNHVDGTFIKGQFIDLNTNGTERLCMRYRPASDSGVELERTTNNVVLWRAHVRPPGVEHSLYHHDVSVHIEGDRIFVTSTGARTILEVRALRTGEFISRKIEDVQK